MSRRLDTDAAAEELARLRAVDVAAGSDQCGGCGCTNNYACVGGCYWIARAVCSRCGKNGKRVAT